MLIHTSQLKSHIRAHTWERPFQCQRCDRNFNHYVSLRKILIQILGRTLMGQDEVGNTGTGRRMRRWERRCLGSSLRSGMSGLEQREKTERRIRQKMKHQYCDDDDPEVE
ncbi:hypothetical protein DPEC_G00141740 [Dallia pectoralis]|uniref:Uncharacterized protein n=1 Tax=Dallia pectoralis TaxID=75939 RepID=A0ACC2GMK5_DALPE|nr:hypothetical protein DPEC_G00141740 [Dallia pectoralis]